MAACASMRPQLHDPSHPAHKPGAGQLAAVVATAQGHAASIQLQSIQLQSTKQANSRAQATARARLRVDRTEGAASSEGAPRAALRADRCGAAVAGVVPSSPASGPFTSSSMIACAARVAAERRPRRAPAPSSPCSSGTAPRRETVRRDPVLASFWAVAPAAR